MVEFAVSTITAEKPLGHEMNAELFFVLGIRVLLDTDVKERELDGGPIIAKEAHLLGGFVSVRRPLRLGRGIFWGSTASLGCATALALSVVRRGVFVIGVGSLRCSLLRGNVAQMDGKGLGKVGKGS